MEERYERKDKRSRRLVSLFWVLTPRLRFVLVLLVQGWVIPDIADYLDIKDKTVRSYMGIIKRRARELEDGKLEVEEQPWPTDLN